MSAICFYFQVHQPYRVKKYRFFDVGNDQNYFNGDENGNLNNEWVLNKVANKCYLPTNKAILKLLKKHPEFKVSYSISGVALEQFEEFAPEVLKSFQDLVATGQVELLNETYYHSLSYIFSEKEFERQVQKHKDIIKRLFNIEPKVFRNTELIYNNDLAQKIEEMGYKGILAEGADHILGWRSPDFVYKPKGGKNLALLLKNYKLSDDIAFRFSSKEWGEHPLTVSKFGQWVGAKNDSAEIINLFMDYETFGEHQWEDTGIFEFLEQLPAELLKNPHNYFITPSEAAARFEPTDEIDAPEFYSWADIERDLSAWLSNPLQHDSAKKIYELEHAVLETEDEDLIHDWRKLQTSDHFYYMCTKWFADGDVHKYFNPYETPYDAFITYMNAVQDLKLRINNHHNKKSPLAGVNAVDAAL